MKPGSHLCCLNQCISFIFSFSGYKWSPWLVWPFFLWRRPESFCGWKVYKLLIMFTDGGLHWSMPSFVYETEKVKLLCSALCMAFEHTLLLLPASNLAVRIICIVLCCACAFLAGLYCNFQRKGRLMRFSFALVGEGHNKYQQNKQNVQGSLPSCMIDEIMGLQLFPDDRIIPQPSWIELTLYLCWAFWQFVVQFA